MPHYPINRENFKHNGKRKTLGDTVEMTPAQAAPYLATGALLPADEKVIAPESGGGQAQNPHSHEVTQPEAGGGDGAAASNAVEVAQVESAAEVSPVETAPAKAAQAKADKAAQAKKK